MITAGVAFFLIAAGAIIGAAATCLLWQRYMQHPRHAAGFLVGASMALEKRPEYAELVWREVTTLRGWCPLCRKLDP